MDYLFLKRMQENKRHLFAKHGIHSLRFDLECLVNNAEDRSRSRQEACKNVEFVTLQLGNF